jgi:heme exporter protein B
MNSIAKTIQLIRVELQLDLKKPTVFASAVLQLAALALLSMLSQPKINTSMWNSLFWISLIVTTINGVSKSFTMVSRSRWIYWNQLASPISIYWSKVIYGWLTMLLFTFLNLIFFAWFLGIPVEHVIPYIMILLLVTAGVSTIYTFIGAVASKADGAGYLAPVLSLPVILPLILVGISASKKALNPVLVSSIYKDALLLGGLNFMILILTGILFPFLWKD